MGLPVLNYPTFELILPSTKEVIKLRPFLVKEEKILLIAQQTEDPREIINAIKQVINNCVVGSINTDALTTFDLEYLFIKLRARSVNNEIELVYRDNEDNQRYTVVCDLDDVEIKYSDDHNPLITVNESIQIQMRYPNAELMQQLSPDQTESEIFFQLMYSCIESVIENNNHMKLSDYSKEEVDSFISSLDVKTFEKIQQFFQTMPKVRHELRYTNSLGNERVVVLDNLNDFFSLG